MYPLVAAYQNFFPQGAVAYFKLDESSGDVIDSVSGNNGTNNGATTNVTGKINKAYDFDGLVDYLNIDDVLTPLGSTTKGTWSAWVKPTSSSNHFISFGDTDLSEYILFQYVFSGKLRAVLNFHGAPQWDLQTDNIVFTNDVWHHIMLIHDGTSPKLYVDNVQVSQTLTETTSGDKWINDFSGLNNGRISCLNQNNAGNIQFSEAVIDEVGFWDRNLSTSERNALYNNGNGITF